MGRRTIRRKSARAGAPSKFFMIALALGLALFLVLFVVMVSRKAEPRKAATPRTTSRNAVAASLPAA